MHVEGGEGRGLKEEAAQVGRHQRESYTIR